MRSWESLGTYSDILFEFCEGVAKITINRPEVYNAFRPETNVQMLEAMEVCRERNDIDIAVLTGIGEKAFCSGGDQNVKGVGGYVGEDGVPRLNVLDLHKRIRELPKPVIAMVNGYAIGGGHVLHVVCDLTIASENALFGQTGPKVGSFDGGFGSSYLARHVGQKKAREMWFTCRFYDAYDAEKMGLINAVYANEDLEGKVGRWVRRIAMNSPTAVACTKAALNADQDGAAGIALLGGHLTRLFYMSEEAQEGRSAYLERRAPDFHKIPQSRL